MRPKSIPSLPLLSMVMALLMTACVDTGSISSLAGLNPESSTSGALARQEKLAKPESTTTAPPVPEEKLTKHDAALRFLTAFIRLNRGMALKYATPEAVSKLNWNLPHGGNIPYYDDKMILYYKGGLAKVYFQEDANGSFRVSKLHVY